MDWHKIKADSAQFDALLKKELTVNDVDPHVSHMLAVICYTDAAWIAELPAEQRKDGLAAVHETFRKDVGDMARLIIKGEIP